MRMRLPLVLALACTLGSRFFAAGITAKAEEISLGSNEETVRLQVPDGWQQVSLRFPREEDRKAVSEMVIAYPSKDGQVQAPTVYVRVDLRPLNALEGLSLAENMLDELNSLQKENQAPACFEDASSGRDYQFEEQVVLFDGSIADVFANQDACGVQARTRISLGEGKTLEIGMMSPPESFEKSYAEVFVPILSSARFKRLGVDSAHQQEDSLSLNSVKGKPHGGQNRLQTLPPLA